MPNRSSGSSGVAFLDRERVLAELRHAVTALVAGRAGVREAWLFGSLARGNATPRNDADLLFVVDQDARRPMDRIPEFLLFFGSSEFRVGAPCRTLSFTQITCLSGA